MISSSPNLEERPTMSMDTCCMGLYFYLRKALIMSEQTEKLKHMRMAAEEVLAVAT